MNLYLLLLALLALVAIVDAVISLPRDGYRRLPDIPEAVARLRDSGRSTLALSRYR